jgi:hypothetical protein
MTNYTIEGLEQQTLTNIYIVFKKGGAPSINAYLVSHLRLNGNEPLPLISHSSDPQPLADKELHIYI